MTTSIKYPVTQPSVTPPLAPGFTAADFSQVTVNSLFLGCGIVRPFKRNGRGDFDYQCNEDAVRASVGQILGTVSSSDFTRGELPWRPEFGSLLYLLRHLNNDIDLTELGRVYVVDALRKWEPRIQVKNASVTRASADTAPGVRNGLNVLEITVTYSILDQRRGSTLVPDVTQTELIGLPAA